nr:LysR family transcriptional regulator [Kineosphaera limosa]
MNLQDLRYFLALARHGRLVVAAERIGVEHTTVSRRVQALEKAIGVRLFERTKSGWELTDPGRRLLPHAERIEETANDALDETTGGEATPAAGVVRLVATDGFGSRVVTPALARLHETHPEISIELLTTSQLLSYRVGEFDIALTLQRPRLPRFLTRKLCDYALRLYAAPDYLSTHPPIADLPDLAQHKMIWYIDSLLDLPELRVMHEVIKAPQFALRSSNVFAQVEAAAQGIGIGLLPSFLAEQDPRLVPVLADRVDVRRSQWLLTTTSLANVRRIQIVYQHLLETVPTYADLLIPE